VTGRAALLLIPYLWQLRGALHQRGKGADNKRPTVQIESAAALRQKYVRMERQNYRSTTQELLQATALFERKMQYLEFKGHGRLHDKFLRLEVQEGKILVRWQRGVRMDSVPVLPAEAFGFISLAHKQIQPVRHTSTCR
jgi:hypothetical protein